MRRLRGMQRQRQRRGPCASSASACYLPRHAHSDLHLYPHASSLQRRVFRSRECTAVLAAAVAAAGR